MFKSVASALLRTLTPASKLLACQPSKQILSSPCTHLLNTRPMHSIIYWGNQNKLLQCCSLGTSNPVRTLTKFSARSGKRKSVKAVLKRFYRLNWGIWIHTRSGRHKHLWKKSQTRKNRLRDHVFCNATQSTLLDKMVTKYWRKPFYFVDDPYTPYHSREEFPTTRKKPMGM